MEIVLHLGAHRTASTTFQRLMGSTARVRRAQGVAYRGPRRLRGSVLMRELRGARPVLPWQHRRKGRVARLWQAEAERLSAQGMSRLLLSEENMLGTMRGMMAARTLYPHAAVRMTRLARVLEPCRIGIAIRSYDTWWASVLGFMLTRGGPLPVAEVCAALVAQPRRWRHLVAEVVCAFPRAEIVVWSYEAMGAAPARVADRLLGGLELPRGAGLDWHNTGATPPALRAYLASIGEAEDMIREVAGRFMPFADTERGRLRAQFARDLDWLSGPGARETGGRITYIDEIGAGNAPATGRGRGHDHEQEDRRLA